MPLQKDSIYSRYFYPVGIGLFASLSPVVGNYYNKKPFYAGFQRHILCATIGFMIGIYANRYLDERWAQRDAVIKHYIELHPEDFEDNKRKYKEIFDEWYPIR